MKVNNKLLLATEMKVNNKLLLATNPDRYHNGGAEHAAGAKVGMIGNE
jgi:hypothetical protein